MPQINFDGKSTLVQVNGSVPSGNKPLPEPMLIQINVTIWHHNGIIPFIVSLLRNSRKWKNIFHGFPWQIQCLDSWSPSRPWLAKNGLSQLNWSLGKYNYKRLNEGKYRGNFSVLICENLSFKHCMSLVAYSMVSIILPFWQLVRLTPTPLMIPWHSLTCYRLLLSPSLVAIGLSVGFEK